MAERIPVDRINGPETFGLWVIGYVSGIKEEKIPHLPDASTRAEARFLRSVFGDIGLPETYILRLRQSPWEDAPQSLQARLKLQYDAAEAGGKKTIDTIFQDEFIEFRLNSPYINEVSEIDRYGENFIGFGLRLWLRGETERPGYWVINKLPAIYEPDIHTVSSALAASDLDPEEAEEEFMEKIRQNTQRFQAPIEELQDVARFFDSSRDRADLS